MTQNGEIKSRMEAVAFAEWMEWRAYLDGKAELTEKRAAYLDKRFGRLAAKNARHMRHMRVHPAKCATGGRFKKHCARGGHDKTSTGRVISTKRFENSRLTCVYKHPKNF